MLTLLKKKQNELVKESVQLRDDYLRLKLKWKEKVGKGEILILLYMKPINNLNHQNWSPIMRINGLLKLKEETVDYSEN